MTMEESNNKGQLPNELRNQEERTPQLEATERSNKDKRQTVRRRRKHNVFLRVVMWVILIPLILITLSLVLIYLPPVQRMIMNKVKEQVNNKGDMRLTVGEFKLVFPLKLKLDDVLVEKLPSDTLLRAKEVKLGISFFPLLSGLVETNSVSAKELFLNMPNDARTSLMQLVAREADIGPLSANLKKSFVDIGTLQAREGRFILLDSDTVKKSDSEPFAWHLSINHVDIERFLVRVEMPYDSLLVTAPFDYFKADNLFVAVDSLDIHADHADFMATQLSYARDTITPNPEKMDYSRIYTHALKFDANNFALGDGLLAFDINRANVTAPGGRVDNLKGAFAMKDGVISVKDLLFKTEDSDLRGSLRLPLTIFKGDTTSVVGAKIKGPLSYSDLAFFSGVDLVQNPKAEKRIRALMNGTPLQLNIDAFGPLPSLEIKKFSIEAKNILNLSLNGFVNNALDPTRLSLVLNLKSRYWSELANLFPIFAPQLVGKLHIPNNTQLNGRVLASNGNYNAKVQLTAPHAGAVNIDGKYNTRLQSYSANVESNNFVASQFLPSDSIQNVSLALKAEGKNFDFLSAKAHHTIMANISHVQYKTNVYEGLHLEGNLHNGKLLVELDSDIPDARVKLRVNGEVENRVLNGNLLLNASRIELKSLGFAKDTTLFASKLNARFNTDLKQTHYLSLTTDSIVCITPSVTFVYDTLKLDVNTSPSEVALRLNSGDMMLWGNIKQGLDSIGSNVKLVNGLVSRVLNDSLQTNELQQLLAKLPETDLHFSMGTQNPLSQILATKRLHANRAKLNLALRPSDKNVNLLLSVTGIRSDTTTIDSVGLSLYRSFVEEPDKSRFALERITPYFVWNGSTPPSYNASPIVLNLQGIVKKRAYRKQPAFEISMRAVTNLQAIDLDAVYNQAGNTLHKVGLVAFRNANGYGMSLKPDTLFVMGNKLLPNPGNAVFYFDKQKSIKASLLLTTEDKGEIELKSIEEEGAEGDRLNLLVRRLELEKLNGLAGMEKLAGSLFADVMLEEDLSTSKTRLTGDLSVTDFTYDNSRLGHVSTALFYEPIDKHTHYVNAQISHNGDLTFILDGKYNTAKTDSPIDADIEITSFPLMLVAPFVGKDNVRLTGFIDGKLAVGGNPKALALDGNIEPDAVFILLPALGEIFAVESKPIRFKGNQLFLDDFKLRSASKQTPITVTGSFNLFDPQAMVADLRIKGDEVAIIDNKRQRGQILYGKVIISPNLTIRGKVTSPRIRGNINLLGGTNATYVYTGTKLSERNNMAGVVVFKDFADTLFVPRDPQILPTFSAADIAVNVHVDPAVRLGVDLGQGHQDYVIVQGGGDLRLSIPPFSEMSLLGNYAFSGGGTVRYNFPVVGRKTFEIDPNSKVAWNGAIDKPSVNFKAINRVRAEVIENKQSRKVDFDVLIYAKETDSGYEIAFDLEAPNDLSLQNQLAAMSDEERSKQAVAMMVSGAFLASEASQANMQKILSNMAISELNNLTGKILDGTDFNVGMELHDGSEAGSVYTDYTYSFTKRFYNDRIRVVFGGRVAAGNLPTNYEQTFIDNVTLEYRLDKMGSQYVTLFHKRNNDNLFEGLVTETGVSYIVRKKLFKLNDLFRKVAEQQHVEDDSIPVPLRSDSAKQVVNTKKDKAEVKQQ